MASDGFENLEERTIAATARGDGAAPLDAVALSEPEPAGSRRADRPAGLRAAVTRYGYSVALAVAVILYLFWPRSYGSQGKWDAGTDDLIFLAVVAYLARQVAKRSPVLLDLPSAISRAVRRRFGFRG